MTKHHLYALVFEAEPENVIFYVGHTNDLKRRETEHRSAVRNESNTEYKYRWCRYLEAVGIEWHMVDLGLIEDDEDTEYAWVLKIARDNIDRGIEFIEGLPLTNMKAGDFLEEILHKREIATNEQIRNYRIHREQQRKVSYERDSAEDFYTRTEEQQTRNVRLKNFLAAAGEASSAQEETQRAKAAQRAENYLTMINDSNRKQRIKDATDKMENDE